jgi:tetratricopeptide (TPR) repeat protein
MWHRISFRLVIGAACLFFVASGAAQQAQTDARQLQEAQSLISSGQSDRAETLLQDIIRKNPADAGALTLLGVVRGQQGKNTEAEQLFRQALAADPDQISAWRDLALALANEHRYADALDACESGLKKSPRYAALRKTDVQVAFALAQQQLQSNDQEGALISLLRAQKFVNDDADLLSRLGILEDRMKIFHDADIALKRSLSLRPNDPTTLYALAHLKTDQQMPDEAAGYMRQYLAINPNDASAHYGMGRILRLAAKPEEAAKEYQRSIDLHPDQTESYYELGEMAVDRQQDDQAEPLLQKVLKRNPEHGGALTAMGIIALRRKDYPEAEEYLRHAIAVAPEYGQAHYQYAMTLMRMGRREEAQQEFAKAAELNKPQLMKSPGTVQLQAPK